MTEFGQAVGFGLATAAIIALASVGLSLQISVTNFVNFAYGDFMTLGAYAIYVFNNAGLPLPLAALLGCVLFGALVLAVNWVVFRPFVRMRSKPVTLLIVTIGLSFIIQNAVLIIWGANPLHYALTPQTVLHIGPFQWTPADLGVILGAIGLLSGLHLFLRYTTMGQMLRATSNDRDLAAVCGINVERITGFTWFVSGMLAALAGAGLVLEESLLSPTIGFTELFLVFAAIILGGIGRIYGAMVGAVVIGLLSQMAAMYLGGAFDTVLPFAAVILLLLLRPQGLFKASTSVI